MGGKNRATMVAAAFVAVAVAAAAGVLLASRANQVRQELGNSQLAAALTATGEKSRIAQVLADPESSELLLKYVNAMASVLTNLEQSPGEQFAQFEALLAAQRASGAKIERISCGEGGLSVTAAGDAAAAWRFQAGLEGSGCFLRVERADPVTEDGETFTIDCRFPDGNL